ncbi:MAG TPA: hypothetical protein EYQ27_18785 [Gemmatimonadetes bacterium]|nr:hypothetical protein [Gemmatimonadota bacterium]
MSRSLAYDVAPLLAWMEAGQGARRRDQHWVSLTLLATGLLVLLSLVRVNVEWLWVSLTLGLAAPWYGHHIPSTQATSRSPKAGYEALVATDYFQRFGHHDADGSNLGPMITAFRRSGFWPRYIENFGSAEDLSRASVIALIAPRVDLPSQHVENLCSAMEGGALVLIAASGPEAAGADSLLRKLGVSVTRNLLPQVRRSEEVSFMRPYELIVEPGIVHEPLVVVGGAIAIVYVPRGDGGAIVFGDTAFFSSRNIESSSGHHEGAQALISTLLARFGGGDEERFGQVRD